MKTHRAGLPTHKDLPDLYEDGQSGENQVPGLGGENTLTPSRYRRIYHFEKEPYFFAKEYEDPFCHQHPNPWSEGGYYYYKDEYEKTREDGVKGSGN